MDTTNRHDLTSNFTASLRDAERILVSPGKLVTSNPAWAARVIVEGALEAPHRARVFFDAVENSFNSMRTGSRREQAIASFRFALRREVDRAVFSAPDRWKLVTDSL